MEKYVFLYSYYFSLLVGDVHTKYSDAQLITLCRTYSSDSDMRSLVFH